MIWTPKPQDPQISLLKKKKRVIAVIDLKFEKSSCQKCLVESGTANLFIHFLLMIIIFIVFDFTMLCFAF